MPELTSADRRCQGDGATAALLSRRVNDLYERSNLSSSAATRPQLARTRARPSPRPMGTSSTPRSSEGIQRSWNGVEDERPAIHAFLRSAPEMEAVLKQMTPLARIGAPEEVAKTALFLASNESSFVAGVELFVAGGVMAVERFAFSPCLPSVRTRPGDARRGTRGGASRAAVGGVKVTRAIEALPSRRISGGR